MSKFLKVKCDKCNNEQHIFSKATIVVKCLVCENVLAEPSGGVANIKAQILQVVE